MMKASSIIQAYHESLLGDLSKVVWGNTISESTIQRLSERANQQIGKRANRQSAILNWRGAWLKRHSIFHAGFYGGRRQRRTRWKATISTAAGGPGSRSRGIFSTVINRV